MPTAAEVFLEPQPASEPAPEPEPLPVEAGGFVAVEAAAPGFAVPAVPLDDPFAAWDTSGPRDVGDDVFAMPEEEAPPRGRGAGPSRSPRSRRRERRAVLAEEPVEEPGEVAAEEPVLAGPEDEAPAAVEIELPPEGSSAIQRAVPRAMAQMGEVRELEVEVPVPAVWTGGKRMTLQLRLTLVPQQDQEDDGGD